MLIVYFSEIAHDISLNKRTITQGKSNIKDYKKQKDSGITTPVFNPEELGMGDVGKTWYKK